MEPPNSGENGSTDRSKDFSVEVRERGVRMAQEHRDAFPLQWALIEPLLPRSAVRAGRPRSGASEKKSIAVNGRRHGVGARMPEGTQGRKYGTAPCQRDPEAGERIFPPVDLGMPVLIAALMRCR